jgi:hypothetical protein
VYAAQAGVATVSLSPHTFVVSSRAINATDSPLLVIQTQTVPFTLAFNYSATAMLRAVTETAIVTGVATNISLLGPAYTNDMAKLWIIRTPVSVSGFLVELVFTTLSTEPNTDFVTAYGGISIPSRSQLRVSGSPSTLPNITSERVAVLFTSDGTVSNAQGLQGFAASFAFIQRVTQAGNISCTGACYIANVQYKWSVGVGVWVC